ncbi:MAG: hypothetical protein WBG08_04110 [Litorimonas sp.]
MFRDLIFYPLAASAVAGIVALALFVGGAPPLSDSEILEEGWRIGGSDLTSLTVSPGSGATYSPSDGGYMRLSQQVPLETDPPSIGVFATLGPAHERVFAGRPVRVTVRARTSRNNPLPRFQAAYVPVEAPASAWAEFPLGLEWRDYSFDFVPPETDADPNVDLVAVFPGEEGANQQMELASIRVEVIAETP